MTRAKLTLLILLLVGTVKLSSQSFEDILWTADWSLDGKYIAFGGNHGVLYIYSGEDYQLIDTLPVAQTITNLNWHPNSDRIAIVTQFETPSAGILNMKTKELKPFTGICPVGGRGLRWNQDGSMLAVGDNDGLLLIYTDQGVLVDSISTDPKAIIALDWHPTDKLVATVGSIHSLYNLETQSIHQFRPRVESVLNLCIAWHPSGEYYASGDYGDYDYDYKALLQWREKSGTLIKSIEASPAEYRNIRWSPSGEYLATASDKLRIWSKDGILLTESESPHLLWGLSWHPDGSMLITTSIAGDVTVWDRYGKVVYEFDLSK